MQLAVLANVSSQEKGSQWQLALHLLHRLENRRGTKQLGFACMVL